MNESNKAGQRTSSKLIRIGPKQLACIIATLPFLSIASVFMLHNFAANSSEAAGIEQTVTSSTTNNINININPRKNANGEEDQEDMVPIEILDKQFRLRSSPKNDSSTMSTRNATDSNHKDIMLQLTDSSINLTTTIADSRNYAVNTAITKTPSNPSTSASTSSVSNIAWNKDYLKDIVCHGCRHKIADTYFNFCGSRIQKLGEKDAKQTLEGVCDRCFTECSDQEKQYLRFDQAAPRYSTAKTNWLGSVPASNRLSPSAMDNFTHYLNQPENVYPRKLHLFDYNPSIVLLPHPLVVGSNNTTAVYMASYRVSHVHHCFHTEERLRMYGGTWEIYKKVPPTDYLGIALLAEDLTVLADAVVSPKTKSTRPKPLKDLEYYRNPDLMDFRLFLLQGQIYLSMGIVITPIQISFGGKAASSQDRGFVPLREVWEGRNSFQVLLRKYASCAVYGGKYEHSKNLQYFVSSNNYVLMEHNPGRAPHDTRQVDLEAPCGQQPITNYTDDKGVQVVASFGTVEEVQYPYLKRNQILFMGDRGSSCCIQVEYQSKQYFVGVSHPKTHYPGKRLPTGIIPNSYLSRFYAFEIEAPYNVVARTGKFCLGYSQPSDNSDHPIWN